MSFRQTKICLAAEGIELSDINVQRRQFLKTSVGAAAVTIAPGMLLFDMAHGKSEAVSSKIRWGMLIDTAKCVDGCKDRKSTRLNSSHGSISYAVFCLNK